MSINLPASFPLFEDTTSCETLRPKPPHAPQNPQLHPVPQRNHLRRHVHLQPEQQNHLFLGVWRRHQAGSMHPLDAAIVEVNQRAFGNEEEEEEPTEQQHECEENGERAAN